MAAQIERLGFLLKGPSSLADTTDNRGSVAHAAILGPRAIPGWLARAT
jgi:hypothetical protein